MTSRDAPVPGGWPVDDSSARRPAVSVVIPCHDAVAFVPEALESVLGQTFPDYEIIVVNDGSPETATLEALLRPYRARIRYLRQEHRGPSSARNLGVRHAAGEYVAFLDSDDVWLPGFLAELVRALEQDASLDMVYANSVLFGPRARSTRPVGDGTEPTFANLVLRRCHVHPSCVVAHRAAIVAAELFDERFTYSEDLDLWARLVHRGARIGYRPEVLAQRRIHGQSLTASVDRLIHGQREMSRKLLATLPALSAEERAALERSVEQCEARLHLVRGTEHMLDGRYVESLAEIEMANDVLRSWKLRVAIAVLRVAPRQVGRLSRYVLARHPVGERLRASRARDRAVARIPSHELPPPGDAPRGAGELAPQPTSPE